MKLDGLPIVALAIKPPYASLHDIPLFGGDRKSNWGALPWLEPSKAGIGRSLPLRDEEKRYVLSVLGHEFVGENAEQTYGNPDDFFRLTLAGFKEHYAALRAQFFREFVNQPSSYNAQLYDAAIRLVGEYQQNPS